MSFAGGIAVVGAFEHPTRFAPNRTAYQIAAESARGALADAGLTLADVDGYATSGVGPMGVMSMCHHLNLQPDWVDSTSIGGSSFLAQVANAGAAIQAGLCKTVLITYGSTAASDRFAVGTGGGMSGDPTDAFVLPYGPTIVGAYGMVAQRHIHEFGTTAEQLAEVAVTMRNHAALNPRARYRNRITVDDVLASRMVSSPLHLLDCCLISDGGGALVVTSAERARGLRQKPIAVLGAGQAVRHSGTGHRDIVDIAARQSGAHAFAQAGLTPEDIDFCMIYDSFTITVLATLENLGFCGMGEGGPFVENGAIGLGGRLPLNPDGGGLSSNHPGMRGIFLVIEAVRQLREEAGDRQVSGARTALCHGTGGWLGVMHSGATLILGEG
jgi:acetyl-CoA C-acetyltransferase